MDGGNITGKNFLEITLEISCESRERKQRYSGCALKLEIRPIALQDLLQT